MSTTTATDVLVDKFLPIYLDSLRLNSILDFDLYLKKSGNLILYRKSSLPFKDQNRRNLIDNNVDRLYISAENRHIYQRYIESNIKEIIADTSIPEETRAGIVYDSAKMLVKDVLNNPTVGENIRRSQVLVENTVSFVLAGHGAFHNLLRMMSFDYHTYTHSVNVCAFSLGLARFAGIDSLDELTVLGTGALLHDVGKTRVPESVLKKPGKLTGKEMSLIKMHPQWGYDLIMETNLVDPDSYHPVLEHHERENGSGYPKGLIGDKIHTFSKIVAIADVFDAMTTKRVYRQAIEAFPALKTMFDERNTFNRELLEQFTKLMGPSSLGIM